SVESVQRTDELLPLKFETYASINSSDHVLLVRDNDQVCIQSGNTCLYMYISESFAFRGLEQFDLSRIVDIDELLDMIESYCQLRNLQLDIEKNKDNFKTSILNTRVEMNQSKFFTCTIDLVDQYLCPQTDVVFDLDTLLGPAYATRGIKRKHQEVPSDTESNVLDVYDDEQDELWESTSGSSAKSDRNKTKNEIERVQKKANKNIPLEYTKDSAYVPFEFALRAAVFVAIKFRPDLLKLNHLSFRLNMDGTLMGNKHVVAISVNCVDGGLCCQTAKKLVPVGIFEIQKESNELLRQTLPKRFLDSIQSVKQLQINKKKSATIKVRLGGDYQNAVYVFGLAGVHNILAEASRTGEYEPTHTKKLEEKIDILNKHAINTIGKRFFFKFETENNVKTIVSCGRFSGHLQQAFFVDSFPYEKIIENKDRATNAKNLVQKFKAILQIIKTDKSKRTSDLAEVAKSFVKDFRHSGLRAGCTPYMHLIGTHLAEQDKAEDLRAYDMQGVEKSNDLLSRLYFSSSNRAKNPLRTMMQNLYRRLEMNFADPKDRVALNNYSLNGIWTDTDSEEDDNSVDEIFSCSSSSNQSDFSSVDDNQSDQGNDHESSQESDDELDEEESDQAPYYITHVKLKNTLTVVTKVQNNRFSFLQ
ncbi:unnamed protein product, partial [Rotaria socialis]